MRTYIDDMDQIDEAHPLTNMGLWKHRYKDLKDTPDKEGVKLCENWIEEFAYPRKTFNRTRSSYGLKHVVEDFFQFYITNGEFIQAAINQGYRFIRQGNSPNAFFNMSFPPPKRYIPSKDD